MEMKRMRAQSTVVVPPQIGALLSQITETPDLETALRQGLASYIGYKRDELAAETRRLEQKWGMTYSEFLARMEAEALDQDSFSFEVESDFWEWERVETLLHHVEQIVSEPKAVLKELNLV